MKLKMRAFFQTASVIERQLVLFAARRTREPVIPKNCGNTDSLKIKTKIAAQLSFQAKFRSKLNSLNFQIILLEL
jgi:hypothetical protein